MVRSARDAETAVLAPVPGPAPVTGPVPRSGAGDDPTVLQQVLPAAGRHRRGGVSQERAIFVDRSGRRKRRVTWALALAAVGGLLYTVALAASMLGGVDADSALPIPGESTAPSTRSPSASPTPSPVSKSPSARAPRGPAPEVQAPASRSARPKPTRRSSSAPAAPPPSVAPTTEESGSFWSSLFPSPRD
ncbi:hypothetical protein [Cryptosporangium arvum]|jgi:hypothetical protein|uniref:hypothetical protein n=1 Tax=Cryptosporangium arvum TaxID=80871 RepID=UPI0004AD92DF|nr:hypothetical protein [Cryptosporangium arvum]